MQVSSDVDQYLNYFIESICFLGKLQISAIKTMVEYKGQGAEYISCSFDPDDEDYREGYVTLCFWKPAVEQDTMVFVDNKIFYDCLMRTSKEFIQKEPQVKDELEGYLHQIKMELNI
ncbi:hypothetical protein ADH76_01190 [Enterocloster clostridioformis]|nr:ribonuclease toxin immunity protein CdiI [Enterocloster clostridioformis]ANU44986.1 hypothetical protein A4V08_03220 [Lachnoclostridium sp. YL32]NDO27651.1 hypothetical protein [Enterocloster clostridioformis]OXE70107.1 hypothetical protein ADH76_01190 [Enterocloster clostridioformis]QQR00252.1 hypothetical protein I5Q83_31425 [Enterocloster clostridioformis]